MAHKFYVERKTNDICTIKRKRKKKKKQKSNRLFVGFGFCFVSFILLFLSFFCLFYVFFLSSNLNVLSIECDEWCGVLNVMWGPLEWASSTKIWKQKNHFDKSGSHDRTPVFAFWFQISSAFVPHFFFSILFIHTDMHICLQIRTKKKKKPSKARPSPLYYFETIHNWRLNRTRGM